MSHQKRPFRTRSTVEKPIMTIKGIRPEMEEIFISQYASSIIQSKGLS
jgi:hypothetical protein